MAAVTLVRRFRSVVAADLESLAADRGLAQRRDDGIGDALLDVDQREAFVDLDRTDDTTGDVRLVGDGADEVAGPQPRTPATANEETDPRSARAGAIATAQRTSGATLTRSRAWTTRTRPRATGTTRAHPAAVRR
jgi:hypothetical protein